MNSQAAQSWKLPPKWLRFLIVVILVTGLFFRFVNLDRKVYSYDEAITSLRISGYTWTEMVERDFNANVISVEDLQKKYQRINLEKGLNDTIKGLATEEAQLPPLYFVMVRFWAQLFGSSVAVTRSLSAVISLLVFPCVYWLCLELFESSLVGWMAVILMAVSPFHILYAQDSRPYILLAVTILLSSAALLRAMRLSKDANRVSTWVIYAATVALGLYSHLLFALVAIGHGIYIFAIERFRFSKMVVAYIIASVAGILAFSPWIVVFINNLKEVDDTVGLPQISIPLFSRLKPFITIVIRVFIDTDSAGGIVKLSFSNLLTNLIRLIIVVPLLSLIGYSIYFICRDSKRIWLFILTLIGVTGLAMVVLLGKVETRYLVSCYLGIQLAIAYLLATKMTTISASIRRQKLWQLVAIAIAIGGVISGAIGSQAQLWWNKYPSNTKYNPAVARIVNQTTAPLVIADGYFDKTGTILSLSYLLDPKVRLQLIARVRGIPQIPDNFNIPDRFSDVFLYRPSNALRSKLEKLLNSKINPDYKPGEVWLWRLEK